MQMQTHSQPQQPQPAPQPPPAIATGGARWAPPAPLEPKLSQEDLDNASANMERVRDGSLSVHLSASELVSFSTVGPVNALRGFDSAKEVRRGTRGGGGAGARGGHERARARGVPTGLKVWAVFQYVCLAAQLLYVASFVQDFQTMVVTVAG